ncbi:hypothetical protein ACFLEY_21665 [Bradyrhizobium sp. YCK136]|uniref:Uncharacterized protein n=1 Tax=Bradyrhizobium diazoefficiens TaxID=1355477 RepID=A0A0E4BV70_9BRAD|nr:hypothetical protein [Bradyrhizobium diazoefficiens]BAR61796.1 hypothetical protein NK6_8647 [Bradyrhizobium diazoefficiens]BCA04080.1 hypothetical protein H12S4_49840 [Bradyrhizobium diazoefficiens]BCA21439.1 hypothetical protein BDHH15_46540 [Bradyrhizobium diazoefficiens]BCE31560.1 hypothetical protein XF2B_53290 [Bradyrhizobium diazoefficiens]BCE39607.1 hypothetical protein XF3B_46380 [Bradyrhizobium diazoefficiens]
MMSAAASIAQLDRFLAAYGEDIVLTREDDDNNIIATVTCRARPDRTKADDAPSGIKRSGFNLILSPTPLLAAGWPDGDPANIVPRENEGDKIALDGSERRQTVVWVDAKKINNQVVRIDLRISG